MILDNGLLFSDAQAVTASAASTNYYDQTATTNYAGTGATLYLVSLLDVAMTDGGSDSTVTVTLQSDDNASFTSAATVVTMAVFTANSAAGTVKIIQVPAEVATERYIRAYYTVANGNLSTGSFTTFLTTDIQAWRAYADNITIS
jgi:hypothetical protein